MAAWIRYALFVSAILAVLLTVSLLTAVPLHAADSSTVSTSSNLYRKSMVVHEFSTRSEVLSVVESGVPSVIVFYAPWCKWLSFDRFDFYLRSVVTIPTLCRPPLPTICCQIRRASSY